MKRPLPRAVESRPDGLRIIDQTCLPDRLVHRTLRDAAAAVEAIQSLRVRGAPLIGVVGAWGVALEAARRQGDPLLRSHLARTAALVTAARPTAVNLGRAVHRAAAIITDDRIPDRRLPAALRALARRIEHEEVRAAARIARFGQPLLGPGARVLTICNTGRLATPGVGTALGIVYAAYARGRHPFVYVCETRPLLQGARLTATELGWAGVEHCLITDGMVAAVLPEVDVVLVGADRIAANGDFANKIGTETLAIAARSFGVPLYVAAPRSTLDLTCRTGRAIIIEERSPREVITIRSIRVAPRGTRARNPAFDVTSHRLVAAFVFDSGIVRPPFGRSLRRL